MGVPSEACRQVGHVVTSEAPNNQELLIIQTIRLSGLIVILKLKRALFNSHISFSISRNAITSGTVATALLFSKRAKVKLVS